MMLTVPLALFVYLTYDLNSGGFSFHVYDAVIILFSSHGNIIWFAATGIAGSVLVLLLARSIPVPKFCIYLGGNTLVLFCLNGFFYHFVNDRLAAVISKQISQGWALLLIGIAISGLSILATAPAIPFFNRYLPWVTGKKHGVAKERNSLQPEPDSRAQVSDIS
jgi:acyltransferase